MRRRGSRRVSTVPIWCADWFLGTCLVPASTLKSAKFVSWWKGIPPSSHKTAADQGTNCLQDSSRPSLYRLCLSFYWQCLHTGCMRPWLSSKTPGEVCFSKHTIFSCCNIVVELCCQWIKFVWLRVMAWARLNLFKERGWIAYAARGSRPGEYRLQNCINNHSEWPSRTPGVNIPMLNGDQRIQIEKNNICLIGNKLFPLL